MKPHKYADVIKAWADGAQVEYKNLGVWYTFVGTFILHFLVFCIILST